MARDSDHITILMCTYNGARHLPEQLESLLKQHHRNWSLWVSDDGSRDETRAILEAFRDRHGDRHPVRIIEGPQDGSARNFLSLLCHPDLPAGHVALSDQDDVWLPGKLSRALHILAREGARAPEAPPLIYGGQSFHVNDVLETIGASTPPAAPPSFANALVQNVVSGHSAVLTPAALALVRQAGVPAWVPFHDWWLYQLVTGCGGRAVIDQRRVLLYRQHKGNVIGAHRGVRAMVGRAAIVLGDQYGAWIRANTLALNKVAPLLEPDARRLVRTYLRAPSRGGLYRVRMLQRLGMERQTRFGTACLYLAGFLGRV